MTAYFTRWYNTIASVAKDKSICYEPKPVKYVKWKRLDGMVKTFEESLHKRTKPVKAT